MKGGRFMPTETDWMRGINDDARLSSIIMPGSHDAGGGKTDVDLNWGVKEKWAVCQHGAIYDQALWGSRFFDCRVFYQAQSLDADRAYAFQKFLKKNNANAFEGVDKVEKQAEYLALEIKKKSLKFGHFSGERQDTTGKGGIGGAYGGGLKASIFEAIRFLREHPTEFLILRFSHSGWPEKLSQVMKYWYGKYAASEGWQDRIYRSPTNIASEFVRNLRGKLVMIFDGKHTSLDPAIGLHRFSKFEDTNAAADMGLTTCGTYAGSSKVNVVVEEAKKAAERHFNGHGFDHLHFVYYQQTMTLKSIESATHKLNEKSSKIAGGKPYTGGARTNLPGFLGELTTMANQYNLGVSRFANVISHDFVDVTTSRQIIGLNSGFQW